MEPVGEGCPDDSWASGLGIWAIANAFSEIGESGRRPEFRGEKKFFFFLKLGKGSLLHFLPFPGHLRDQIPLLLCFQQSFIISLTSEKEKI